MKSEWWSEVFRMTKDGLLIILEGLGWLVFALIVGFILAYLLFF